MSFFENGCVLQRKHVRQTQPKSKLFTNTVIIKVIIQKDMNWMIVLTTKAMKMIHLRKCTTLVKMESVPPINLRKYVLGKSSTPLKKW